MRDFRSGNRRNFGGRDSGRPLLHDAVCDECGKNCKVPFKPSGDKPIYCSDCFEKKGGKDSNRSRDRRDSSRRSFGSRDSGRSSQASISDRSISQFIEKIEILNTKLDKIINLLSSAGEKKSELVEEKKEKKEKKDRKEKKKKTKKNKKSKKTKADKTFDNHD